MSGRLIVIAGPTAVGKSACAIGLARLSGGEIVSADAYQCYRRLDIGTAKPSAEELSMAPHHMINVYDPDQRISVSDYAERAGKITGEILSRDTDVLLTGGSGLYIDSIVFSNYDFSSGSPDEEYRKELKEISDREGPGVLYDLLSTVDPVYASLTHPNNVKRVIRALEYHHATGEKMSSARKEKIPRFPDTSYFVLSLDREFLYPRIDARVNRMMEEGLLGEVKELYSIYHDRTLTSMRAIGYAELIGYIEGETDLADAVDRIKQHSRNYAKRQYTWFRSVPGSILITLSPDMDGDDISKVITERLNNV